MDFLAILNVIAIICEVVGGVSMIIGVALIRYTKDYHSLLGFLYCALTGVIIHLALRFDLLNFWA